ncbi:MAG: hypothetical protein R2710_26315 [Acidimicrobiales bacterium]
MGVVVAEHPTSADYWGGAEAPEHFDMSVARRLGADYPAPLADNKVLQLVEQRAGFKFRAAYRAVRTPGAQAFVSMSEQVGVPLAVLDRHRTPHVVVAHNVITPFKRRLQSTTHWLEWFDRIVVFST